VTSPVDLSFALTLPPEKAIAYFQAKGYAITWRWTDLWQEAQAKAFTVAGVTRMDMLQDIREAVDKAISSGTTYADFEKTLVPILQAKGWWGRDAQTDKETGEVAGKGLTPWRMKTIYETNVQTAYAAGRYKRFMDNVADRPYWMYSAVMDRRTRPSHAALNGLVFRADDPFWDSFYPPNGFRCRCSVRALDAEDLKSRSLELSRAQGRLDSVEVPVSRHSGAETVEVARFEYAPKKFITPDPGWSYNPGKTAWQPDLGKYSGDLVKQYDARNKGR